ncbi:MAG: chain-length determining protein [Muribaculaceae bacterium]|nr:chain-length determining protein [Muribaculaceae bacterium]MDE6842624.1 chain-length determining protein [Muribaculaceae bacterium]
MDDQLVKYTENDGEEKEIDLLELAETLWKQRKKLIIWGCIGAVVGLIVAFSIPREYSSQVKLAPEATDSKSSSGLGALASMAGLGSGATAGMDAVYPQLYPDVVSSVPFMTSLFDVPVHTKPNKEGKSQTMTVAQFMEDETSSPWWSAVLGLPFKLIGMFKSEEPEDPNHKLNPFQLTKNESDMVDALSKRVTASVDAKTNVVTIGVQMQDPVVSALLADTVVARLQNYITDYRTNKARQDLKYAETLNEEAQANYYKAQQQLANYLDRHQGLAFKSGQIERERLENETALAFSLYNQTAQQVQKAQAKVQETTPVYAVVSPATVPIKPSAPRKALILVGFVFLAVAACAGWILFLEPTLNAYKARKTKEA